MTYEIYIKSHCELPDWEDQCEAESFDEAAKHFQEHLNCGEEYWDIGTVKDSMRKVKE